LVISMRAPLLALLGGSLGCRTGIMAKY